MTGAWHQENYRVPYHDTDQMGVVHHGNYINWFEIGRTEWMRDYGMSYRKMEEMGLLLPVLDVNIKYKQSASFDDPIAIFTKISDYSPVRLEFYYEARKIGDDEFKQRNGNGVKEPFGELLAKGTTLHMWVNQAQKPVRINKAAKEVYEIIQNNA